MSVSAELLEKVVAAAGKAGLEFVLVGNAAAALNDAPVTTQDVDLFVRHTPRNLQKIASMAGILRGSVSEPFDPVSRMMRIVTENLTVDFVFDLSNRKKFESVRSRALRMKIGRYAVKVASLQDIIAAKEAAGRPKDLATLPILKATLRAKQEMDKESK